MVRTDTCVALGAGHAFSSQSTKVRSVPADGLYDIKVMKRVLSTAVEASLAALGTISRHRLGIGAHFGPGNSGKGNPAPGGMYHIFHTATNLE